MATIDANIFREYDIRGIVGRQLTDETVAVIGNAIGTYLRQHGAKRIAIGYDARERSPGFCEIMTESLHAAGCDTLQIGMVPTPVLYHTLFTKHLDGGVMITGSHNPPEHNGFKISLGTASLFGEQIQEIKEIVLSEPHALAGGQNHGTNETIDVLADYCRDLVSRLNLGPRKLKVVVDAGNGMGGITAVPIYQALGVDIVGLYTDPDPTFPNHHPDPSITENLTDLINTVRKEKAGLGIAFDGDADRITVVDETGRIIWGDELMILLSRSVLATHPGATIIAEAKCSQTLFDDIANHGGVPLMWKAGHSIIKAKMKETGAVLAGEMSGHIFFADRFYGFDDAAYAGARVMEILSKTDQPLSAMLADLPKTFSTPELRINCPDEIKFDVVQKIADHFAHDHKVITIDGVRIIFDHGWGIVRASNTQALLVMRFEADSKAELVNIQNRVETMVNELIETSCN
ncbi:MAG: phosphomannomutase/phosphoglucomutase [Pyrinomonadaceae bacterium]|nr:phosphomannomutase/phosphoglucomutase [Chloracidobacterium sp.]